MSLTLRTIKGSKLSSQEMDGNLTYLQDIALLGSTQSIGGDSLRTLLAEDLEFELPQGAFSHGVGKIEGIFRFSIGEIFNAFESEDVELFKSPVLMEEGNYIIYAGTRIGTTQSSSQFMMVNGILFPQGGDAVGPGTFVMNSEVDENTSQIYTYLESVDFGFVSQGYSYNFDSESNQHLHYFKLDAKLFGVFEVISVTLAATASSWGDVVLTSSSYATE